MRSKIEARLKEHFSPTFLQVEDDSEQHIGHAGYGAGHYTVKITAPGFKNGSRIAIHRAIYQALAEYLPDKIHALRIVILPSST